MVHPSYKQGHVTTGIFGIPNVNDCNGTMSRAEWDAVVRNDAVSAQQHEEKKRIERRQKQAEQAAYLQQQVDAKLASQREDKAGAILLDLESLQLSRRLSLTNKSKDQEFASTYRTYLQRCQSFSEASRAVTTLDVSPRKTALQREGGLMPFVLPAEALRTKIDADARFSKTQEARELSVRERSSSPRVAVSGRWRAQQEDLERENETLDRRQQSRDSSAGRRKDTSDRRAERAEAVAASPRQREELSPASLRPRVDSQQLPTRREIQESFKRSLEVQLAEKRRLRETEDSNNRSIDKATMKTLGDTLESTRIKEQRDKERRQNEYRTALEHQLAHPCPTERGFLPEVTVKPFRRHPKV